MASKNPKVSIRIQQVEIDDIKELLEYGEVSKFLLDKLRNELRIRRNKKTLEEKKERGHKSMNKFKN